jgi:succinylarginine dihydrolase
MSQREWNFDGLVGPTHNYAGLSPGNLASQTHEGQVSNPREAALQGLEKMRFVASLGVGQAVLPPHPRPSLRTLRVLGFSGTDEQVLARVATEDGHLLRLCSSAAAMWTANAATSAPSSDAGDGLLHLTVANLQAMFHRVLESETTEAVFRAIFADERYFTVHGPLPGGGQFSDEGAANHVRLAVPGRPAMHVFSWGRSSWTPVKGPAKFPARQSLEASHALARLHQLHPDACLFPQQSPMGIDAGAFHTDVLAVGHETFLMLHEEAFVGVERLLATLSTRLGESFRWVMATHRELPLDEAVVGYPFNSQVLTKRDGTLCIVAPLESKQRPRPRAFLERVVAEDNPVNEVHYLDVRQSMNNGGGPACLRQRIRMTDEERAAVKARVFFDETLDAELTDWIRASYRDRLEPRDLADPALARESMTALDELTRILRLGSVYDFQQTAR